MKHTFASVKHVTFRIASVAAGFITPLLAFAQPDFDTTIVKVSIALNRIISFLVLLATLIFLWGVVKYITAGDDEERTKDARHMILYGVIGLAVMIAVWGLVFVLLDFVFDSPNPAPLIPLGPHQ